MEKLGYFVAFFVAFVVGYEGGSLAFSLMNTASDLAFFSGLAILGGMFFLGAMLVGSLVFRGKQ